jgi:hypothetical protein
MADIDVADYRIIFATPGTPPRTIRQVTRPAGDPDAPDMLTFEDDRGRLVFWVNRDVVSFVELLEHDGESASRVAVAVPGGARDGLARIASASRPGR